MLIRRSAVQTPDKEFERFNWFERFEIVGSFSEIEVNTTLIKVFDGIFRWDTQLYMSLFLSVCVSICSSVHLNDISMCFFFHFFQVFFRVVRGFRGKKHPKMKNKNYIRHVSYPRNSVAYDHDFWYTFAKWWYLQTFFLLFSKFWFRIKKQKVG